MKTRGGVLVRTLAALSLFFGWVFACSPDDRAWELDLVEVDRAGLTTCTSSSQCPTGMTCCAGACAWPSGKLARLGLDKKLEYSCYAAQSGGHFPNPPANNILPDFSHAGYKRGGVAIPDVWSMALFVAPRGGELDDSGKIQAAIDQVAAAVQANTNPGVVTLAAGTYYIDAQLRIEASKVVLKGAGQGPNGTILLSRIPAAHSLVKIGPVSPEPETYPSEIASTRKPIVTSSVPVGSKRFTISGGGFVAGDEIVVVRTPNSNWISDTHMTGLWEADDYLTRHPRRIVSVVHSSTGNQTLTIDIPIVDSIESAYGGGYVAKMVPSDFVEDSGLEDLRLDTLHVDTSTTDDNWSGVRMSRARNCWVRRVTVRRYGYSAVLLKNGSQFNTIEEVAHIEPKSPISLETGLPVNSHRYSFNVGDGIGNLFQRCYTHDSRHSFVTGKKVTGPHVWLDCVALSTNSDDGPHMGWATGLLYDNIHTEPSPPAQLRPRPNGGVRVHNVNTSGGSHGWTGAQMMIWNCQAPLVCDAPAGGMNWVVGGIGSTNQGTVVPGEPYGIWQLNHTTVAPRSLYLQQLEDRLGWPAVVNVTSGRQQSGRIWEALRNWAGNGRLDSFYPDPTCTRGKKNGRTCCPSSCASCTSTCNASTPPECCVPEIIENDRSCAHHEAPCVMPSPNCEGGISNGNVCCSPSCSQCGGGDCGVPPNSGAACCTSNIRDSRRSCLEYPPPCVLADPNCVNGVQGNTTCCHASCTQCGGSGCSSGANTSENCCGGTISDSGRTCDKDMAPCVGVPAIVEL